MPVKGSGVFRGEQECLRNIPTLARKLANAGVRLSRPIECFEVQGERDSFEPVFEGVAEFSTEAETAVAGYVNDRGACETNLKTLLGSVAANHEIILEYGCVPVSISNFETGEVETGQFQPMVVLLKITRTAE